ncbi:AzlC family ABC transporter permease [Ramlibacter albus]|uniref:AzlC family ABC transporter permease n=1 Tax=Ramlibacter albus TaxID=2079448 RepID=A0A923M8Q7_9BURK|nr:AzlC family ABC transporter permease [Ramlibacter albus]MBC5765751.1 AzlC family ABC transporter permease [Ramlibacter albus]
MSLKSRLASIWAIALATTRRPLFREGVRDGVPMAIGIAAWGVVAGVAMAKSDMGVPLAIFMSLLVYAGSAQIAALPLIVADAPMWVVWATTLCVSLRFMAFSFHYRPFFLHLPRGKRLALSYLMGDTNFALFFRRFPEFVPGERYEDYFLGSALTTCGIWQVTIITGIVAGHGIPASWGLGFAGTMALLALTCTQLRDPSTWGAAIVAACAAVAAYALPLKLNIVVAIAAAVAFGALADQVRAVRRRGGP